MNVLKTYLQNVQARLENATPINLTNLPDYASGLKISIIPVRGFEMSVDVSLETAKLINHCPTDLSTLLQVVKIQNDALSKFEYIDEVWALEKKDIYDIANEAIEQVNKLVSGGE